MKSLAVKEQIKKVQLSIQRLLREDFTNKKVVTPASLPKGGLQNKKQKRSFSGMVFIFYLIMNCQIFFV